MEDAQKSLDELVKHVGRYSERAFLFVREGLSIAARQVHGPETAAHRRLYEYMTANEMDWETLAVKFHCRELPATILADIDEAGGYEKLNRHVSGRELCWALRDYATKRWGMLARAVLESWNIKTTIDFGRIVFGFIELEMMQKQEDDSFEDFIDVFSFDEAFDASFRLGLRSDEADPSPDA